MSPPRTDPIPNQDKSNLGLQKYQCLPSHVPPFSSGIKSLRNESKYDNTETTDTSCTDKYDMSHTNRDDYIENAKAMKNPTMMTNTKRIIHNINTVMKVLSTQPKNNH